MFPPFRGGISRFSLYLQNHLSQYASLEAYNYKKLYPVLLFPGKSQFNQEKNGRQYKALLHSYNPFNWKKTADKIYQLKPDVFIFSHWHPFFAPSTISILRHLKQHNREILTTGIFHNVVPHETFPLGRHLTKRLISLTDLPVTLSTQTHNELNELHPGKPSSRLFHPVYSRSLPDTSRQKIRSNYGIDHDELVFVFFGLIRKYKGLDLLFKALNDITPEQSGIRVIVAGEFYIKPDPLLALIPQRWREHVTVYNRFFADREADELLYASDVMVLPYHRASQSGILADAVNFELPVICSDQPGFTDIVTHKKHGLIIPTGDAASLAEAIKTISDPSLLSRMRQEVQKLQNELNWDRFSENFYQTILRAKKESSELN